MARATVDSAWGPVEIAAGPGGVVAVAMLSTPEAFEASLARRGFAPVAVDRTGRGAATDQVLVTCRALERVLAGDDIDLGGIAIDISDRPPWDRRVLEGVRAIPRGGTASYGEVARRIGRPGAARAVGGAVGRNPVGLLVPCHRVIAGNGTLGGYGAAAWGGIDGGLAFKRALLALEGVSLP